MTMNFIKKHSVLIAALILLAIIIAGDRQAFGATVPVTTSFYSDSLQSGVNSTATSFTLVKGKDAQGRSLSGTYGFVLDQGTASQEIVYCTTVSGVNVSGCARGVDLTSGTTTVTALEQVHNRGASVQITTAPVVNIIANILRGIELIPQGILYDPSVSTSTLSSAPGNTLADVDFVNFIGSSGCANAATGARGCAQFATGLQAASSTATGSTGAGLVLPASIATDTPNTATRGSKIPVTSITGFLNQSWLDHTLALAWSGLITASGGLTSTATTTLAGSNVNSNALVINGVATQWPSAHGVAGTLLSDNGSGVLSWSGAPVSSYAIPAMSTTTNDGSGNSYVSDTVITTGFQPSTFEIAVSGNANGAGGVGYVVATNYFEGTNCVSGLTLKPNSLTNTMVPGSVTNGCTTGPSNDTTLTAGIVNITSTGFTLEISHSGGAGGFPNATLKVSGMAFR